MIVTENDISKSIQNTKSYIIDIIDRLEMFIDEGDMIEYHSEYLTKLLVYKKLLKTVELSEMVSKEIVNL